MYLLHKPWIKEKNSFFFYILDELIKHLLIHKGHNSKKYIMLTWYNFSSDHWGFSRLRSFANLQGENHKQCCQNSFQRTNSVLLRKPPFQKFPAGFIKRMPKYPFFWEMCVFFPQFGEICQKIWKISQFFHQKLNIFSKQKNLNFIKCILFWFSFHESFFRKFDSKRFPFLKKFIIFLFW